jgi:methyl-accepting chemotaxis protein
MQDMPSEAKVPSSKGAGQRSLKNFLLVPGGQLKMAFAIVMLGLLTIVSTIVYFLWTLSDAFVTLSRMYPIQPDVMESLKATIYRTGILTVGLGVVFTIISMALVVVLTHRYVGPAVPIRRLINDLREGRYGARGKLRENDEFQDVMTSLNELAAELEKRHGSYRD